jgi:hypothetical protein
MTTLTEAAECIKQQAGMAGLPEQDVIDAFKTVKIKLFDEGVLSHFTAENIKLKTVFSENSLTTNQVVQWLWDFGDGQTSTEANPEHTFSQSGDYPVKLTVTDQSEDQDTFERVIQVTDQYCAIRSFTSSGQSGTQSGDQVENQITKVVIGETDLNYTPTTSNYSQDVIELTNASSAMINIAGNNDATYRSTTWQVFIDLNDNGIFGDTASELVFDNVVAQAQPYALNTVLDLSVLPNDGSPKYMRIIGDYVVISPCSGNLGKALDIRVKW